MEQGDADVMHKMDSENNVEHICITVMQREGATFVDKVLEIILTEILIGRGILRVVCFFFYMRNNKLLFDGELHDCLVGTGRQRTECRKSLSDSASQK